MRQRILTMSFLATLSSVSFAYDYNGTPVAWAVGTAESSTTISSNISNDWRPTSIDATTPGSTTTRFATGYVKNTGSHERYVTIARNVTSTTINNYRSAGFRIEDVERIAEGRYTALFGKLSENPVTTGWFVNLTSSQITTILGSSRRLLELDSVVINGVRKYNGVYVDNSGANAKAWGWMPNQTMDEILDWASDNNMRIIDLDPRGSGKYAAVFVKRKAGERYYVAVGSWSTISEAQESTGSRIQVLNKLEGSSFYAAILVNNVNAQSARISDLLLTYAGGGHIGAYVAEVGGPTIVDLRGSRDFYPCSAIKVLIHAAALNAVPTSELNTYKVNGIKLSQAASLMMVNSDNYWTYEMNKEFGYQYINQFGRDSLGTTSGTFIEWHYGDTPPDSNWNAHATLKDMTNIYANRGVLGTTKLAKFRAWMITEANSDLYKDLSLSLKGQLGMSDAKYNTWKSLLQFEFKAGNVFLGDDTTRNLHWVNVGRVSLPFRIGQFYSRKSYVFGHFVNDSVDGYLGSLTWGQSAGLVKEQMKASMETYL